jgi:hypothetical protein
MFGLEFLLLGLIAGGVVAAAAGDDDEADDAGEDADAREDNSDTSPDAPDAESSNDFIKSYYTTPKGHDFSAYRISPSGPIDTEARFSADFDALSRVCRGSSQLPEDILGARRALDFGLSRRASGLSSDLERFYPR